MIKKKVIIIVAVVCVLLAFVGLYIWMYGGIEVKLLGNAVIDVSYQEKYVDEGFIMTQYGKKVSDNKYTYEVKNDVDTNNLGEYSVTYRIKHYVKTYDLKRTIHVVDNVEPIINTNIETIKKDYCTKKELTKLEFLAADNYDGDVTNNVVKEENEEGVILKVTDTHGNTASKNIPFSYTEKPKDKFTLNGDSNIYIAKGTKYSDPGASYRDGCGEKVDVKITTSGSVDANTNGEYKITYTANNQTLTRKVTVYTPSSNSGGTSSGKVIYLTFDDGPGSYTERVLNTLAKYDVKATFFVTHQFGNYVHLIQKEHEQGHAVAVHSYTHNWNIYKSVDAYVNDFNKMNADIEKYTGSKSRIFRFPGGSSNTVSRSYATGVVKAIASRMTNDGYQYFDWDVDSGDAAGASSSRIHSNVVNGVKSCSKCIVLMHDIKANTVNELDSILKELTSKGYKFGTLSVQSPTVHHKIAN